MKENIEDKLLAENQEAGDGVGHYCVRNLYERKDGSRYSVIVQPWKWIEQPVLK